MIGSQPYSISMNPNTHFLHHKIFPSYKKHQSGARRRGCQSGCRHAKMGAGLSARRGSKRALHLASELPHGRRT